MLSCAFTFSLTYEKPIQWAIKWSKSNVFLHQAIKYGTNDELPIDKGFDVSHRYKKITSIIFDIFKSDVSYFITSQSSTHPKHQDNLNKTNKNKCVIGTKTKIVRKYQTFEARYWKSLAFSRNFSISFHFSTCDFFGLYPLELSVSNDFKFWNLVISNPSYALRVLSSIDQMLNKVGGFNFNFRSFK